MEANKKMKLVKLDPDRHNLYKVAELIYETDAKTLNSYFKDKENSAKRLKKLLQVGSNSWGHEHVYIVTDDNKQIYGVLVAYRGDEISTLKDIKSYFRYLNFGDALGFILLDIGYLWDGASIDNDDLYISDIAVNEKCRGRGIGTFILKKSLQLAKDKKCKRVVLDVDPENDIALRLYEKMGFEIFIEENNWFLGKKRFNNMEYKLIK